MIYVPDLENYSCFVVVEEGNIKAYESMPQANDNNSYRLYYTNNHYIYSDGVQFIESGENIPICISSDKLTSDYYYRNDLPDILVMFLVFVIVCIYLPFKIILRLFRRFQ